MEISANAKINLTLDILRRREDGYHDLQMVMQSVSLADELTVTPAQGGVGTAVSDLHFLPTGGKNLAQMAAAAFRAATRARQGAFNGAIPDVQEIPMLMDAFHEDGFWDELGGRCLSCNACANVCPTCYCFDIRDTLDPGGASGRRERVWDACTSPQFAMVAGGHNFRATPAARGRHRMYHKLNGFLATHDRSLCVGCGRCAVACKVDISPIEVLRFFERKGTDDAC